METFETLAKTIDERDPYTGGHCGRVRTLALCVARYTGLSESSVRALEYGALLHDIGKICIPGRLLNKKGKLDDAELRSLRLHTVIGESILETVDAFKPCLKIIRGHHEWYDGTGYPDGIGGETIDVTARIVALSDAFDAMTSTRPYRAALPVEEALDELLRGRRTQFDPSLVDLFIENELYSHFLLRSGAVPVYY